MLAVYTPMGPTRWWPAGAPQPKAERSIFPIRTWSAGAPKSDNDNCRRKLAITKSILPSKARCTSSILNLQDAGGAPGCTSHPMSSKHKQPDNDNVDNYKYKDNDTNNDHYPLALASRQRQRQRQGQRHQLTVLPPQLYYTTPCLGILTCIAHHHAPTRDTRD